MTQSPAPPPMPTDPIERIVFQAMPDLIIDPTHRLDFRVPDTSVYIECKQFHTPRITEQMALEDNIIVIQGRAAAEWFAATIKPEPITVKAIADRNRELVAQNRVLADENARLRGALEYYANTENWFGHNDTSKNIMPPVGTVLTFEHVDKVFSDQGHRARTALAAEIVGSPVVYDKTANTSDKEISASDTVHNDTPTLESLLAKVPEGWVWSIEGKLGSEHCATLFQPKSDKPFTIIEYDSGPALALSAALDRLNTQGEKASC